MVAALVLEGFDSIPCHLVNSLILLLARAQSLAEMNNMKIINTTLIIII
jgi:hypothetical protein